MSEMTLVIGIGNPDRCDDAAGVVAVRHVSRGRVVECVDCSLLIDMWEDEEDVVVVDAMRSKSPIGTVRCFDATTEAMSTTAFPSTHAFGLAETIELARALDRLPHRLTVYGIEAGSMELGVPMSPEVVEAAVEVAERINEEV